MAIQEINEGITGQEAATIIYQNDLENKKALENEVGAELLPENSRLNAATPLTVDGAGKGVASGWFEIRYPASPLNYVTKNVDYFNVNLDNSGGTNPSFWSINKLDNSYRNKNIYVTFKARKVTADDIELYFNDGNQRSLTPVVTYPKVNLTSDWQDFAFTVNIGAGGLTPYADNRIGLFTTTAATFEISDISFFIEGTGALSKTVTRLGETVTRLGDFKSDAIPNNSQLNADTPGDASNKKAGIFEIRYPASPLNYVTKNVDYFNLNLDNSGGTNPAFWAINKISETLRGKNTLLKFDIKSDGLTSVNLVTDTPGAGEVIPITTEWVTHEKTVTFGNQYGDMRLMFYRPSTLGAGSLNCDIRNISLLDPTATLVQKVEEISEKLEDDNGLSPEGVNLNIIPNFKYKTKGTGVAVIGLQGDSWTDHVPGSIFYARDLSRLLRTKYGNGGGGWYDFANSNTSSQKMASIDPNDASDVRGGVIVYKDQTPDTKGINFAHAEFNNGAFINLSIITAHTRLVIHYFGGGGTFRYRLDGGAWVLVNTGVLTGYQTLVLNVSDSSHTLEFEVTAGNCIILGVDMQRAEGVRVHKFGNRGLRANDVNSIDGDVWSQAVSAFNLDTMTILLGTNDRTIGRTPDQLKTDINTLINLAKALNPFVDLAIISPSNNRSEANYEMTDYSKRLKDLALELKIPFIDLIPLFGSRQHIISKNTFSDSVHPTTQGGEMIAEYLFKQLFD